jgi:hypothetical protein
LLRSDLSEETYPKPIKSELKILDKLILIKRNLIIENKRNISFYLNTINSPKDKKIIISLFEIEKNPYLESLFVYNYIKFKDVECLLTGKNNFKCNFSFGRNEKINYFYIAKLATRTEDYRNMTKVNNNNYSNNLLTTNKYSKNTSNQNPIKKNYL